MELESESESQAKMATRVDEHVPAVVARRLRIRTGGVPAPLRRQDRPVGNGAFMTRLSRARLSHHSRARVEKR